MFDHLKKINDIDKQDRMSKIEKMSFIDSISIILEVRKYIFEKVCHKIN